MDFPPLQDGKSIDTGMDITVYLTSHNQQSYGHMKGKVTYVDSYVTPASEIKALLEDDLLVNAYMQQGPVVVVLMPVLLMLVVAMLDVMQLLVVVISGAHLISVARLPVAVMSVVLLLLVQLLPVLLMSVVSPILI